MRRVTWAAVLLLACQLTVYSTTITESASTVVPKGTLLETLVDDMGFGDFLNMDLTEAQELQNQGVEPGDIKEVYLVDFVLAATDPPGADLAFLESLEVWVEAPGLQRVMVASQTEFPPGVPEIAFDLEDVDLTPYVVSESMTFETVVSGHRPPDDTTVEATFSVELKLTGQGACNQVKKKE